MKNACMGRLGGLLRELNKEFFSLSSPRNCRRGAFGDLPLCKELTRTNNRFPTTTLGNDDANNRSRIKTLRDDDNNQQNNNKFPCALHRRHTLGADNKIKSHPERAVRRVSESTSCVVSHGFTLIELLVVVLIIGILAAVAVPQYQLVVDKTKWTKEMIPIKALERALEAYYMGNGVYPDDNLAGIDIDISGCYEYGSGQVKCGSRPEADKTSNWIDYNGGLKYEQRGLGSFIDVNSIKARVYLPHSGVLAGKTLCRAYPWDARTVRLCKSLGGVLHSKYGSMDEYLID